VDARLLRPVPYCYLTKRTGSRHQNDQLTMLARFGVIRSAIYLDKALTGHEVYRPAGARYS
jgi:hypothetical protein